MNIIAVQTQDGVKIYPGDKLKLKVIPIVNDEEDKDNPVYKTVTVKGYAPNEGGDLIRIIGSDDQHYYEDEILEVIPEC